MSIPQRVPGGCSDAGVNRGAERLSAQPPDLRRQNLSAILRTLLSRGPTARAELSAVTGLAPGSITKLTAELAAAGLVHELAPIEGPRQPGRPRVPVAIDGSRFRAAGVHVGLLRTTVGLVDLTGEIVSERVVTHRSRAPRGIIRQTAGALQRLVSADQGTVLGVGASTGGVVDPATGFVSEHPALDWHDVPLRDQLADATGLPVVLDSTTRALPLAETWFGNAGGVRSLLHVFVGNVVGTALLVDGKPYLGASASAGLVDHLPTGVRTRHRCSCGGHDCLLASASDRAVVGEAAERGLVAPDSRLGDVLSLARSGDRTAARLLRQRAERVGGAVARLVELLDPELVVLGGGVVHDPSYLADVRASVEQRVRRPLRTPVDDLVVATSFGPQAVMFSSAALFLDAFYRSPTAYATPLRA
jgi:predicted NBD/HSP70 family sugar kinase